MVKKIIKTDKAPLPIGSYNQGVVSNGFVFTAGQVAIDPKTSKLIDGNFKDRVNQIFDNLENILIETGSSLSNAVKFTVFLTDMGNYADINEVFNSRLDEETAPARSLVEVSGLPAGTDVEIECVAVINE
ncbi:MAG: Rid family detoxifying hydrolase [Candidatus Marinimicrobia bacterium]|jgi:2-iminobutanoate/2-iminopropanoate deaminase|nr:Rid family detoxifying hydrolase [Candidatus Neomarinimicrobiota bacterium]MDP6230415.1 Rid family detoxifying hydrolase [Candidatus Neomarinimicrobiota bacterium]MDP7095489.1 Rid family detoxifying hydrolase [Candidatus Neomarinimicrobiota bacterium]